MPAGQPAYPIHLSHSMYKRHIGCVNYVHDSVPGHCARRLPAQENTRRAKINSSLRELPGQLPRAARKRHRPFCQILPAIAKLLTRAGTRPFNRAKYLERALEGHIRQKTTSNKLGERKTDGQANTRSPAPTTLASTRGGQTAHTKEPDSRMAVRPAETSRLAPATSANVHREFRKQRNHLPSA